MVVSEPLVKGEASRGEASREEATTGGGRAVRLRGGRARSRRACMAIMSPSPMATTDEAPSFSSAVSIM